MNKGLNYTMSNTKQYQIRKYFLRAVLILFFVVKADLLFASHIIGGDITCVYAGSATNFVVTVTLFRDKTSATALDNTIYVGVFNKATDAYVGSITLSGPTKTTLTLGDACYTPSLSIEKGVYTTTLSIPASASGYYLSYLRCCRNGSVDNISAPSTEGWLAYCEIPNPSIHNSSPVFSTNPRAYMCQNYLNTETGFSATDADGDVLVYKFSNPLSCSSTGQCSSTSPNPGASAATAGSYGTISWVSGYSTSNPMGDASMAINSSTGVITCTPPNLGVYDFCVTVEEWRSGSKIGEIRRDFQFEVLSGCSVLNLTIGPSSTICNGTTSTLTATGASSGFTYSWNPGSATTSAITVTPTASGTYNYTVTATNAGCTSTTTSALVVNALPTPTIATSGNICLGQSQTLTASGGATYNWSNGSSTAAITASSAGTYTVWVTSASNCTASPITGTISAPITATTYTWTGTTSTDWFTSTNWTAGGGCLPTCSKDVVVPNVANDPVIGTGSGAAACNSITLASGAVLTFSGAASELDICGDFTNNGATVTAAVGLIKFMGSTAQNYSSTSAGDFNNVTIANSASPPIVTVKEGASNVDMSLNSGAVFTFTSGILKTEGSRMLVIKNTATGAVTGHGTSAYVYGRLKRSVVNTTTYDFPVGGDPAAATVYPYELLTIRFSSITGLSALTVCFDNPNNTTGDETGNGIPLYEESTQYTALINNGGVNTGTGANQGGVWTVIPDAGTGTYDMTLYGRNYDNAIGSGTYYSVLKRSTYSSCGTIPNWSLDGAISTSSLASNVITAKRTGMTGFSQFAIAKHPVPLPVELLDFSGRCNSDNVLLNWTTGSEVNNNFFTIDKSIDAKVYSIIGTIPGAGNSSSILHYDWRDYEQLKGTTYYRLSQTDYNGTKKMFSPIAISCDSDPAFDVNVYSNPVTDGYINLSVTGKEGKSILIVLSDVLGKELYTKVIVLPGGDFLMAINPEQKIANGLYFITASSNDKYVSKKIIVK